jgi:hypothetical protein
MGFFRIILTGYNVSDFLVEVKPPPSYPQVVLAGLFYKRHNKYVDVVETGS